MLAKLARERAAPPARPLSLTPAPAGAFRAALPMLALFTLLARPATAQVTASVAAFSDLQARGMTLNDGRPALQASVNLDSASGWYGGASAAQAKLPFTRTHALWQAYAGYAARLGNDGSWEAGASRYAYRGASEYDFSEVFAGVSWKQLAARVYYSPHYYGLQGSSWYAEVNGGLSLADGLELQAHVGRLHAQAGEYGNWYRKTARTDLRLGLAWSVDAWTLSAGWTGMRGDRGWYGTTASGQARAFSAGVAYHF